MCHIYAPPHTPQPLGPDRVTGGVFYKDFQDNLGVSKFNGKKHLITIRTLAIG
jgi:hypothetical protein